MFTRNLWKILKTYWIIRLIIKKYFERFMKIVIKAVLQLTQNIFRSKLVEITELVVAIEQSWASNDRHQDNIDRVVLGFKAIAWFSPSMAQRLSWRHQWITVRAGASFVNTEHAGSEGDERHDDFPWMWGAELAMRMKQTSRLHHVNDLSVESESETSWGLLLVKRIA